MFLIPQLLWSNVSYIDICQVHFLISYLLNNNYLIIEYNFHFYIMC